MDISIILPSRNEGNNVELITARIAHIIPSDIVYEVIFIDDSDDDTVERLEQLSRQYDFVRYVHRSVGTGLSTAILDGFAIGLGDWFIVMDADLQHPPESLLNIIDEIRRGEAEIIIPSRFIPGGDDGGLNMWRKLVSWTARMMARVLIRKVNHVTDPTSGFFAIRRETAFSRKLDPIGWKILLELLARSEYTLVKEIPYSFQARDQGRSKFNIHEQWNYIRHLVRLVRGSDEDSRFWKFCLVGASGTLINLAIYVPLVKLEVPVTLSFAIATSVAMLNNFLWNNSFTWKYLKQDRLGYRLFKFVVVSLGGLLISSLVVYATHNILGIHYLIAGLIGMGFSTGWNYLLHNFWTFGKR